MIRRSTTPSGKNMRHHLSSLCTLVISAMTLTACGGGGGGSGNDSTGPRANIPTVPVPSATPPTLTYSYPTNAMALEKDNAELAGRMVLNDFLWANENLKLAESFERNYDESGNAINFHLPDFANFETGTTNITCANSGSYTIDITVEQLSALIKYNDCDEDGSVANGTILLQFYNLNSTNNTYEVLTTYNDFIQSENGEAARYLEGYIKMKVYSDRTNSADYTTYIENIHPFTETPYITRLSFSTDSEDYHSAQFYNLEGSLTVSELGKATYTTSEGDSSQSTYKDKQNNLQMLKSSDVAIYQHLVLANGNEYYSSYLQYWDNNDAILEGTAVEDIFLYQNQEYYSANDENVEIELKYEVQRYTLYRWIH